MSFRPFALIESSVPSATHAILTTCQPSEARRLKLILLFHQDPPMFCRSGITIISALSTAWWSTSLLSHFCLKASAVELFPAEQHPLLFHSEATSGNTTAHWLLWRTFILQQNQKKKTLNTACGRTGKNISLKLIFQSKYPLSDRSITFWEVKHCLSGGKNPHCNNNLISRVKTNIDSIFV